MSTEVLVLAAGAVALLVLQAFAIEVTRTSILRWVWLYSAGAPQAVRDRRRAELASDIAEQIADERRAGHSHRDIAVRLTVRWLLGIPADLAWAMPRTIGLTELTSLMIGFSSALGLLYSLPAISLVWANWTFEGYVAAAIVYGGLGWGAFFNIRDYRKHRRARLSRLAQDEARD